MKDLSPKISVIVPVYKVEAYLARCVQSILNQTYKNLEILLIDDGSPDASGKICDEYAKMDNRIKVVHKNNGGVSDARNVGIEAATGDYLGFVDSDDYIHPEMYEILCTNLKNENADFSFCFFEKVYNEKTTLSESNGYKIEIFSSTEVLQQLFTFSSGNIVVSWNKLFKKELFNGIMYPKGRRRGEDESIIYKLICKSERVLLVKKVLYYYYQREKSVMHEKSLLNELCYADVQEERITFFADNKMCFFYEKALKRYCIWLLSMAYIYGKHKNFHDKFVDLQQRRKVYIDRLLAEYQLPRVSRFVYVFAKKRPFLPSFFAFHKLFRYDIISKMAGLLFDDAESLMPK